MTGAMRFMAPRPLDDHAWRTSEGTPGVAHFYGWPTDHVTRSRCWSQAPIEGTRQAAEDDRLCPDCEGWYWEHQAGVSPIGVTRAGTAQIRSGGRISAAARTDRGAPWAPD